SAFSRLAAYTVSSLFCIFIERPGIKNVSGDHRAASATGNVDPENRQQFKVGRKSMNRILIVDDLPTNRELIREALLCLDHKIMEAADGGQALEMMENEGADLGITDLRMPGISGVDLLRKLRVKYPDTTVILVTACGTVETAVEAMKAGAHDYIARPLDVQELRSVVRRVLQQVQIHAE